MQFVYQILNFLKYLKKYCEYACSFRLISLSLHQKFKNIRIMDADLRKKLKDLQKEIEDHAKYLQDSTYHPYGTIKGFARKLDKIIEEDDNKDIWL